MTKAACQAGDADLPRPSGLNSNVQTSTNDHCVRYNLCHNESASVIPYLILAVMSCQERLNLNKTRRRYFKYGLDLKYSAWFAKRVA